MTNYTVIATGNPDLSGVVNGTTYKGANCEQFENQTLTATTDVFIGGSCAWNSQSKSYIQEDYQDGSGDWTDVVKVPQGTNFTVEVINKGDLRNVAEVKVTLL